MNSDLPFKEREINGTTYRASVLPLEAWAELTEYLASLLGDPLGSILRGDTPAPEGVDPTLSGNDLMYLLGGLVDKLSKQNIVALTVHMGKCLRGDTHVLDSKNQRMWWPRHMKDLASVVTLFLEAQYADFYEGLSDSLPMSASGEQDRLEKASELSESLNP